MSTQESYISYFTPSEMTPETLEFILVKRHSLIERLVERVRDSALTSAKYQSLVLGPRGMGKSHIVALAYHRIKATDDLNGKIAIAWLAEEEWSVASLVDLYVVILEALDKEYGDLRKKIDELYRIPLRDRTDAAAELISQFVEGKTLLLLVENLEEIFSGLSRDELWTFRSYLSKKPFATILATTPSLFNGVDRQEEPFYGFFQPYYLDELTPAEATELLGKLAERREDTALAGFLKTPAAQDRVQAVHDLAGGHPRLYLLFAHLLTQSSLDELVTPFLEFLDELTPYYQDRMKSLSAQQRKIVAFLSDRRGAIAVKDIVAWTNGLTSQTTSGQLDRLEQMGYVRKTKVGRESHYELREPLLRMVLEKKRGRGEPIRLVVDFLRRWYSRDERRERLARAPERALLTRRHLEASLDLQRASLDSPDPRRALALSRVLSQAIQNREFLGAVEIAAAIIESKGRRTTGRDWFLHACCLEEIGDHSNATASYKKATELDSNDSQYWSDRGLVLTNLKRYEEALANYDKAIELDCNDSQAWNDRSFVLTNLQRYEEALTSYDKAIELNPKEGYAWNGRGDALINLKRYEEALASYDTAIELDPNNKYFWSDRGDALGNLARYEEALSSCDKAIELDPKDGYAWNDRSFVLTNLQRYEEALASCDKAIELNPKEGYAWNGRGDALINLKRYEEALASYDTAIELDPHNTYFWLDRGGALGNLARYEEALASYDKAIELEPNDEYAWNDRGDGLNKLGRFEEAIKCFDKAIELDPNEALPLINKAESLLALNRWNESLESLEAGFTVAEPSDHQLGDTEVYCSLLFGKQAADESGKVAALVEVYQRHNLSVLVGQGLVDSIPILFEPSVTQSRAESWLAAWISAADGKPDLVVPLRLLAAAIAWKPKRDPRALLALAIEERRILEKLLQIETETK